MTSVEQGWKTLQSRNFAQAAEIFADVIQSDDSSILALSGLTRVFILTSNLESAQSIAELAIQQAPGAEAEALLGEVLGLRGNRAQAERHLLAAVQQQPSVAVYGVLLGEQQVRQGRWQDGTDSILRALQLPDDGRAAISLQNMLSDLINAINSGRIAEVDGMKFINRLDYSLSSKSSALTALFASARRAIHAKQALPRAEQQVVIPRDLHSQNAPSQQPNNRPQPAPQQNFQQTSPQQQAPTQSRPQNRPQPQNQPQTTSSTRTATQQTTTARAANPSPSRSNSARLSERQQRTPVSAIESRPFGTQQTMLSKMYEERMLNEEMQKMVPPAIPPKWPSQIENPIDQIPPILVSKRGILGGASSVQAADFRLTGGDITVEIVLERCLQNLLAATYSNKATTLPFRPASITRMELNLRDGLLDNLAPLNTVYLEDATITNPALLGLGKFLGDCIVQTYNAAWAFETPPENSYIHIGKGTRLQPFSLASEWLNATDLEDVNLHLITRQAQQAVIEQNILSAINHYIDPTPGFEGDALAIKLAELWIAYRFSMREVDLVDVAETIQISEHDAEFITFSIGARWVPDSGCGPENLAVTPEGNVHMAYVRSTGEFLLLGSRKHFARFVSLRWDSLNADTAGAISKLLSSAHLPAAKVVSDDAHASKISARFGTREISAARLSIQNQTTLLTIWFYTRTTACQYQLTCKPDELIPCQLRVLKTLTR